VDRNLNSLNRSDVRLARTNAVAGSADALVRQALRDVLDDSAVRASADGKGVEVRELLQWQAVLECPHRRLATSRVHPRLFNPGEAVARFFFSLLGTNSLEHIAFYLPAARGYSADGVLMSGHAHGNRLFQRIGPASQIERAVALLAEGDISRALMTIHAPTDAGTGPTDLPCVTSLFLFRRGDALHTAAQLRSSDVFRLLLYDLFELTMLQEYVASLCGLALGVFSIGAHAAQIIGRDRAEAARAVAGEVTSPAAQMAPMPASDEGTRAELARAEARIRYAVASGSTAAIRETLRFIAEDHRAVARATPGRRAEFATGRDCARAALGARDLCVSQAPDRSPVWPIGFVGSLTHAAGLCAAAVGRATDCAALGIDIEASGAVTVELATWILRHDERAAYPSLWNEGADGLTLFFSAKEAVYKACYPLVRRILNFHDVRLELLHERAFRAQIVAPEWLSGRRLQGRYSLSTRVRACAWLEP